ncbi:UNVERIFIED_CONTAM: hypothetical protein FKN15_003168 [Acipenser sinensis]
MPERKENTKTLPLKGEDSWYRDTGPILNGRLPTAPGKNCPTIQYEACSSCCTVPSQGEDSWYCVTGPILNGRLPTAPGKNCPTIQYEAHSSCCTVPSQVERETVDSDSFALCHMSNKDKVTVEISIRARCLRSLKKNEGLPSGTYSLEIASSNPGYVTADRDREFLGGGAQLAEGLDRQGNPLLTAHQRPLWPIARLWFCSGASRSVLSSGTIDLVASLWIRSAKNDGLAGARFGGLVLQPPFPESAGGLQATYVMKGREYAGHSEVL